nr:hypothetical protein Q903MT_gene5973 [Picea sitchensis]
MKNPGVTTIYERFKFKPSADIGCFSPIEGRARDQITIKWREDKSRTPLYIPHLPLAFASWLFTDTN